MENKKTLKEAFESFMESNGSTKPTTGLLLGAFSSGAQWGSENINKKYSEEEVIELLKQRSKHFESGAKAFDKLLLKQDLKWFEQIKKK